MLPFSQLIRRVRPKSPSLPLCHHRRKLYGPRGLAAALDHDVDREGVRVAVGSKSAYDLYLTRTLKHAQIVRVPTSPAAIELFLRDKLEAAAGVKQPLLEFAKTIPTSV